MVLSGVISTPKLLIWDEFKSGIYGFFPYYTHQAWTLYSYDISYNQENAEFCFVAYSNDNLISANHNTNYSHLGQLSSPYLDRIQVD